MKKFITFALVVGVLAAGFGVFGTKTASDQWVYSVLASDQWVYSISNFR